MADPTKDAPGAPPPAADAPPVEQDTLFRMQMAVSDFVLGNAKYVGYLVGVALLGSLVYGGIDAWRSSREQGEFAEIARVDFKMPKVEQLALFGLAPMDDPTDTARMSNVEEGAKRYAALGESSHDAAAVYAYLKAADAWKRAAAVGEKGLPGFSADAAYAAALVDAGRADDALAHYRGMAGRHEGFFAERSLILLTEAQVAAGKKDDAKLTIDEFRKRFPQSPRENELVFLEQKIASAG